MWRLSIPDTPRLPRALIGVVIGALLLLAAPGTAGAEDHAFGELGRAQNPSSPHAKDHVVVRIDAPGKARQILGGGVTDVGEGWFRVPVPKGWDPLTWAEHLTTRLGVEVAELDLIFKEQVSAPFTSNDPLYTAGPIASAQWHLHAVDVANAWQTTVGAGVRVAVLDSGVNDGPDGFCEPFVAEYDAVTDTFGPGAAADFDGHGTHVAGSIAQCSGNGFGGAGMAPGAQIMPVDVFSGLSADASHIAMGIDWARENGASVINMSLGCANCLGSDLLGAALERAADAGILLVAASGNTPTAVFYPANHPAVMAVGASNFFDDVADYSARGLGLDLVAPGGDASGFIWQETIGGYQGFFGTSMAAGHVSGAAALLRSRFPTATPTQVRNALNCSASDLGSPGWDTPSGFGLLQTGAAGEQLRTMIEQGSATCTTDPSSSARVGTVQTSSGVWRLYQGPIQVDSFFFGDPGDFGFFGDWDCDGVATPGLYRRSDGFVYLRNSNTEGVADITFFFGNPGDLPLAGDFDGDGCDTVSIYRPGEARFYVINELGLDDRGLGAADYSFLFGNPGDVPFVGDWNGDGIDTPGLRRNSNGFVYLRNSNTTGIADVDYFYGDPGDIVFAGDWDSDGDDTIGLYRPSNGTIYLRNTNTTGVADITFSVGFGLQPVAGDF